MNRPLHARAGLTAALLALSLLAGCGYRFPGERLSSAEPGRWTKTVLVVEDVSQLKERDKIKVKSRADAVLTRILHENLSTRMGPFASGSSSAEGSKRLRVQLEAVNRDLVLEDSSGRANQYRVMFTAHPILEVDGKPQEPGYPAVKGAATYYEPSSGTASHAARMRAETEAMNQLADALVALLAEDFQPKKR
ncbi:MAG: hypothetical protein HQL97_13055 [Magnetococcales bacterium]|nr:hypothetical protein [Magnetococcales bacterium]MBF0262749.1 hypothetical protein [Magnetococcales bacterium]